MANICLCVSWTSLHVSHLVADLAGYPHQGCLLHTRFTPPACSSLLSGLLTAPLTKDTFAPYILHPTPDVSVSAHLAASCGHSLPSQYQDALSIPSFLHEGCLGFPHIFRAFCPLSFLTSLGIRQESSNASAENGDVKMKKFPNMIRRMSTLQSG